jgi:hypothetical protein
VCRLCSLPNYVAEFRSAYGFIGNIGSSRARLPPITRHGFTWIEESKQACRLSSGNTAASAMILAIANVRLPVMSGLVVANFHSARAKSDLAPRGWEFVLEFWGFVTFLVNSIVFLLIDVRIATIPVRVLRCDGPRKAFCNRDATICLSMAYRSWLVAPSKRGRDAMGPATRVWHHRCYQTNRWSAP